MTQTTFRFGEIESVLADINAIPSVQRTSFQARLKDIQRHGLLRMDKLPRGKAAAYGLRELALLAVSIEMCQLGLSTKRAVEVILEDEYPLWMAIVMASNSITGRPEVFNEGPGDTGNDPNQKLWGFSPNWADSNDTDPFSVFLYFDPSVLSPWSTEGEDRASATFFYAGAGIVGESISRWTTGPSRRIALINVTKLVFDIAGHVGGTEGLAVCHAFAEAGQEFIHYGDFDLDEWVANIAKSMAHMVAAVPGLRALERLDLPELFAASDENYARYVRHVERTRKEGQESWENDHRRPDMIIRLPGQGHISVDARVGGMVDQPQADIQWRLDEMREEPFYHLIADRNKYVVLYCPDDRFLASAVSLDHTIIDRALEQNVILASPTTMRAMMAEVHAAWMKHLEEFPDVTAEEIEDFQTDGIGWIEYSPGFEAIYGKSNIQAQGEETPDGDR